jgi:hypothetical protein
MAKKWGQEFPHTYANLARTAYYMGDLDAANEATDMGLVCPNLDVEARALHYLNKGALTLITGKYTESKDWYTKLVTMNGLRVFNWGELIKFADHAVSNGYPDAVYLRAMYRKIAGESIPKSLNTKLQQWIGAKPERNDLGIFFHTKVPCIDDKPAQAKPTNKHKKGKSKGKRKK